MNSQIEHHFYHQTPLRILSFLSLYPSKIFSAKEIAEQTKSSKGATNQVLRSFLKLNFLAREKKGNIFLYRVNFDNVALKQFKKFEVLLGIQKLIQDIQPYCYQIILFGSCANGSNVKESDLDLFIKTEHKSKVQRLINKYKKSEFRIQAVIQDPLEIAAAGKADKVFFEQVRKGIVLWEGRPVYEKF